MNRNPWTSAELSELRRRYHRERTADLARYFGRSVLSVQRKASRMGLTGRQQRAPSGYRTFEQVAAECDILTQMQRDIDRVVMEDARRALGL